MPRKFSFATVDVFTDRRFGGNPLAVFTNAQGLADAEMQALAAEMNYSETTFVLPPVDAAHTARVRIFNRVAEMPFAGHPNVGTGCVLAALGRGRQGVLHFEELAGLVAVRIERNHKAELIGAHIDAPEPLSIGPVLPPAAVAACAGLQPADLVTSTHPPRLASVGLPFLCAEVQPAALTRARADLTAFKALAPHFAELPQRLSLHLYARLPAAPSRLRARMFAPLSGTYEDPATGSANAALAALLLACGDAACAEYMVTQGVEMGRPSLLRACATRAADGIRASVGGGCVPMFSGEVVLD